MDISNVGSGVIATLPKTRPGESTGSAAAPESTRSADDERNLGLEILRRDIRAALKARLNLSFDTRGYASARVSVKQVSEEALLAARVLLRESPLEAAGNLRSLRDDIESAGEQARTLSRADQQKDVDGVLGRVRGGLDDLQVDADRNRVSGATVLSADSVEKQRARIRIRTQDGDVVTLKFRQRETFSAEARADASGSSVSLETTSRSRLSLQVRGELDDGELGAIRAVFSQAQQIADEFFDGDLASAFAKASEFEFDQSELAKVKLNFKSRVASNVRIADTVPYPILEPATPATPATPAQQPPDVYESPAVPRTPIAADEPAPSQATIPNPPAAEPVPVAASEPVAPAVDGTGEDDAIGQFVVQIRRFLQSTFAGFEKSDGQRYFYGEQFKLSLLKTVLQTSAPEDDGLAAERAGAVVDAVAVSSDERDDD